MPADPSSRLYAQAYADLGLVELIRDTKGAIILNPRVRHMFTHTRFPAAKVTRSTPWCAAGLCCWLAEAGLKNPRTARAADFAEYGEPVKLSDARTGDILVLSPGTPDAGGSGHVTLFAGRASAAGKTHGLGANQRNGVRVSAYDNDRIVAVRRPVWA